MRLEGWSAIVREAYPAEFAEVALVATALGDAAVLLAVLAVLYWLGPRRATALVVSYAVAGVGCILLLKHLFDVPRPPESARLVALEVGPHGFPSGHAFAATIVFGGLLVTYGRLRDPRAVAATATLVLASSLSRVVLGVHYLGDVLAGVLAGVLFLFAIRRLVAGDPRRGFAVGICLAIPAVVATAGDPDALVALGGGVGGAYASGHLEDLPALRSRAEGTLLTAVGVGVVGAGLALEAVASALAPTLAAAAAVVLVNAGLFAGILLCPAAVGRLEGGPIPDGAEAAGD